MMTYFHSITEYRYSQTQQGPKIIFSESMVLTKDFVSELISAISCIKTSAPAASGILGSHQLRHRARMPRLIDQKQ
jgi:hypothetical protein